MLHYHVIRYVPDTIAGEFVNVGLILYDGTTYHKFIKPTERAKNFGSPEVWASVLEELNTLEFDERMVKGRGLIQFTVGLPILSEFDKARDRLLELFIKE